MVYVSPVRLCVTRIIYSRIRPFCNSNSGGCQDSRTVLEPISLSVTLTGGPVGAVIGMIKLLTYFGSINPS